MPRYDMVCKNSSCENFEFPVEVTKRMSEENPPCEVCGQKMAVVFLTPTSSPVFKGSGWYGQRK